jgi:hypothetical protein
MFILHLSNYLKNKMVKKISFGFVCKAARVCLSVVWVSVVCQSVCLTVCLSVCVSVCVSVYVFLCLSVGLFVF